MKNQQNRRLAAILFADIVGYTALMQKDEANANVLLEKFHNTLQQQVESHNGQVINNYGDGCVCTFESAVSAMNCAKEVQRIFQLAPPVPVRIGLHSGDVMFKDNNVFGDSVNIASRIESLGVAGAVLFSKRIKRDIANQTAFKTQLLGEFEFKNVNKTMEVFALANEGLVVPKANELKGKASQVSPPNAIVKWLSVAAGIFALLVAGYFIYNDSKEPLPSNEKDPSTIAVLPFEDMSPKKDQEYFGDGIAEEILNTLTQLTALKVSGRTSSFSFKNSGKTIEQIGEALNVKHVLEGSIRKQGDQVRITAQLIDSETGFHLWSKNFDSDFANIFDVQDSVSVEIGSLILGELAPNQIDKITNNAKVDSRAFELVLEANHIHSSKYYPLRKNSDFLIAEEKYKKAIAIEPKYALAYAGIADLYDTRRYTLTDSTEMKYYEDLKNETIKVAIDLNPNLPYVQLTRGWTYLNRQIVSPDFDGAFKSFKKAYDLDTRNTDGLAGLIWLYNRFDLYDDCLKIMNKMEEISPEDIQTLQYRTQFLMRYGDNEFKEVIATCKKALSLFPDDVFFYDQLSKAYFYLNQKQEAINAINKIKELDTEYYAQNQRFEIIKTLLEGDFSKAKSMAPNDWMVAYYTKDFESFNSMIFKSLKDRSTDNISREMSMYNQLRKHPYYQHLQGDETFEKLLKREKENYDAAFAKLPRAESIF